MKILIIEDELKTAKFLKKGLGEAGFVVDVAGRGLARSTIRNYQGTLKVFLDYLCDPRYPWAEICEEELGVRPRQVFDNQSLTRHLAELEGFRRTGR